MKNITHRKENIVLITKPSFIFHHHWRKSRSKISFTFKTCYSYIQRVLNEIDHMIFFSRDGFVENSDFTYNLYTLLLWSSQYYGWDLGKVAASSPFLSAITNKSFSQKLIVAIHSSRLKSKGILYRLNSLSDFSYNHTILFKALHMY